MQIAVTGGAGFIGSALVRFLIRHTDASVVVIDKLTYAGNLESLSPIADSNRYAFEQIDIVDAAALDALFAKYRPDAVVHLAAESHVDRSIEGPDAFIQTNVLGTFQLLQASLRHLRKVGNEDIRFLHVSTDEVFGDLGSSGGYFTETSPYAPSSPYSASKAGSDHLVRAWGRTYDLPVLITNCSNNYGAYQFPEKLIPHMILSALQHKPLPVYGDGSQVRDWLYVDDHVRALWTVLNDGVVGETYNVGGFNEKTNLAVVNQVCALLDKRLGGLNGGEFADLIEFATDRPGHDTRYAVNATKLRDQLGWMPQESFESGIEKTVDWYLQNTGWWQRIIDGSYRLNRIGHAEAIN